MSDAYRSVTDITDALAVDLEKAIKWKFILPILLLYTPPSAGAGGTKAHMIKPIITC